jgi:hypothetical protein
VVITNSSRSSGGFVVIYLVGFNLGSLAMKPHQFTGVERTFIYDAPPTISTFMQSESFGRLLCGPVGSGKTTGCLVELTKRMKAQMPAFKDPIRSTNPRRFTRYAIIRQTLKQLKDTVLKDVLARYALIADWRVSESTLYFREGDVYSEWLFVPLDEPEDKKRLLSTNLTAAYVNESIEIDIDLLSDIAGRCGRYPSDELGVPSWKGIIADTNMPVEQSRWAKFIKRGLLGEISEWEVFKQPGGRDPNAENLEHLEQTPDTVLLPITPGVILTTSGLPRVVTKEEAAANLIIRRQQGRKYYDRLIATGTTDYNRRYVDAEFGRDPGGSAVFGESFKYEFHIRKNLTLVDDRMLIIGQDFGRNPGAVIAQLTHRGQLLVLKEIPSSSIGLKQHIDERLKPVLATPRFAGRRFIVVGDPAGIAKSSLFDLNEFNLLHNKGMPAIPAASNDIDRRLSAVEGYFLGNVGGEGKILIDEDECPLLVEGCHGAYRFPRNKNDVDRPNPEKDTPWSHVQDALQYICLTTMSPDAYAMAYSYTKHTREKTVRRATFDSRAWS